jgi:argininosuccinate lyase
VLSVSGALRARSSVGGTAPERVAEQSAALVDVVHEQVAWANAQQGS